MTASGHPSNSEVQREAEAAIVDAFARDQSLVLHRDQSKTRIDIGPDSLVQVDAASDDHGVVVEAYARQGSLKGAQLNKIAQDVLKLALVTKVLGSGTRAFIVFASEAAKNSITGWLRAAADAYDITLVTVEIDDELRSEIVRAQSRQVMVNALPLTDDIAIEAAE